MWSIWLVTIKPVVQAHPTNIDSSEPTMIGKLKSKIICICVPQWSTQFQLQFGGTIRLYRLNPRKYQPQGIVGTPLYQWVIPWKVHRALSLLQCMEQINRCQKSMRHSLLQAQIHYKSNSNTWKLCRTGSATTNRGTQRKLKYSYVRKWNWPNQQIGCNIQHKHQEFLATKIKTISTDGSDSPTPAPRVLEKPSPYLRVITETSPAFTLDKNTTKSDKSAKQPQSPNWITQYEDDTP